MDTDNGKKTATVRPFAKAIVDNTDNTKAKAEEATSAKKLVESKIKQESKKADNAIKDIEKKW